jgi:acyl-CoA hydrolase
LNQRRPPVTSLPKDKELVLKVIPMPADSNANGDIFGGWVMAQVDLAGAVLPARRAQGGYGVVVRGHSDNGFKKIKERNYASSHIRLSVYTTD